MKLVATRCLFMLVSGPLGIPLMMEQAGVRYVAVFTNESAVSQFQSACCSRDAYQPLQLDSTGDILRELRKAQNRGCGFILVDLRSPVVNVSEARVLSEFLQILEAEPTD